MKTETTKTILAVKPETSAALKPEMVCLKTICAELTPDPCLARGKLRIVAREARKGTKYII